MNIKENLKKHQFKIITIIFALIAFLICFYFTKNINSLRAPDEPMRYLIPQYIFTHNTLPIGNETSVVDIHWGYSYGYLPYITSLIAVFFMKIAALINFDITRASRLVSVFSVVGTCLFSMAIGKEVFKKKSTTYLFTALVVFLPQFIFLGVYFNNDAFSIFVSSMIIFSWIMGLKNNWPWKICVLLGISIGLMSLTYYNAYAYILCSIFIFVISFYKNNKGDWNTFIKKGSVIFLIAFIIGGWFFIRNAILHNGDFLGMNTTETASELYGNMTLKPSARITPFSKNLSFYDAFFIPFNGQKFNWITTTIFSFIGFFGRLEFAINAIFYRIYEILIVCGIIGFLISLPKILKRDKFNKILLYVSFLICMIIPIVLSMYNSYYSDFQPQGRYIMSMLIPLMFCVSIGLSKITEKLKEYIKIDLVYLIIIAYIMLLIVIIQKYFPMMYSLH